MTRFSYLMLGVAIAIIAQPGLAQPAPTEGVTQSAPGVQEIDGNKVPSTRMSAADLTAAIEANRSYSKIKKLFDVAGIASPGPAGTTTYMYKMHDPATDENLVVILFVKDNKIVHHLIT